MKTAFVTGGSRGIGRSIALDLGKKFHVIVGFSVSNDKAEEVSEKIISNGGSSSTVQIDISKSDSVEKVVVLKRTGDKVKMYSGRGINVKAITPTVAVTR